jgi:hypothetical protein
VGYDVVKEIPARHLYNCTAISENSDDPHCAIPNPRRMSEKHASVWKKYEKHYYFKFEPGHAIRRPATSKKTHVWRLTADVVASATFAVRHTGFVKPIT